MPDKLDVLTRMVRGKAYALAGGEIDTTELDLHLQMDEIAEIVAVDYSAYVSNPEDPADGFGTYWFSLDPDDTEVAASAHEVSDDVLVVGGLMCLFGANWKYEGVVKGYQVFPRGIYTAVNPIMNVMPHATFRMHFSLLLMYRILRPTTEQLALIISRRR